MKKILTLLTLWIPVLMVSQNPFDLLNAGKSIFQNSIPDQIPKAWFSNVEIEFGVNSQVEYDYALYDRNDKLVSGMGINLERKVSYGILYSINYPVLNKLTIGAMSGVQYQSQQKISALKIGGILRYHFINYESVNINLMTAYNIALSNNIESQMGNIRLGLQFPITKTDAFNLNLNVFGDYNYYVVREKILNELYESPRTLIFRSYGFSLGLQF
ncbi:hypothetical protein [Gelidibacter maritimus]|uniref:Outer membrane protein beta-barrel domain-containing protein n=1 Tax=Gelidibacter maritimus TaxID=2761487 RepID=A0A7W2M2P6_9FLAO|nr:hypothetical protein [Gelidibacter maritimus]MBA6151568.1 hypothetical protein [Gelidibacter maritimus]